MGRLTFTCRPLTSHTHLWLLWDALITVECTELWSLPVSELPPLEGCGPPREPLGILGAICHCHHLPYPMMHQMWELPAFSPPNQTLPYPNFTSSFLLCRHQPKTGWLSRTLGEAQTLWPLSNFSITVSAIAWWPSWTVFTVASICAILLAQLSGPANLNLMSLAHQDWLLSSVLMGTHWSLTRKSYG